MSVYPLSVELPSIKSLFVEMYFGEQLLSSGTATLIAKKDCSHCSLITNRHNVTGRDQTTGRCLSKTKGTPDNIVIYFHRPEPNMGEWKKIKLPLYRKDGSPFWIEHPTLGEVADVVALNLKWGSDVFCKPYYLEGNSDRIGMIVRPAETVSVIGFPFGLSSVEKLPIWATGFLAQELALVTKENPVFLIDCRARQGQSGSPVIAYRVSNYSFIDGDKTRTQISPKIAWEFLGIYSGRVNPESDLGRVWHVSILKELLEAAENDYIQRTSKEAKIE